MIRPSSRLNVCVDREAAARLYSRSQAGRWGLSFEDFSAALDRSASHRFRDEEPTGRDVERYLEALHLDDLALAASCARGHDAAWNHFVAEFRPGLLAAARACAAEHVAREIADSLYADLFGLETRDGVRGSLFDYFHGRSTLGGWLRAVIAQRVVDQARAARRFEPLPDDASGLVIVRDAAFSDVDATRHLALVRVALTAALAALPPRDRLRLSLYYARQMKLAAVGRVLGESEATVSRKLERTRADLRSGVEQRLREDGKLGDAEIAECFERARADPSFDLAAALPIASGEGQS